LLHAKKFFKRAEMRKPLGNDIELGEVVGKNQALVLPQNLRRQHLYVCGSTGTGKSKLLESLIRQDIKAWRKSKCGLLLLDPHGSVFDNVMDWLSWHRLDNRPIVPIDLRRDDWIISYNMLRKRDKASPSVIVDGFVQAMAYVFGATGTDKTPLFERWASNLIYTLYEKGFTLVEAEHLIDSLAKHTRSLVATDLKDKIAKRDWEFANTLNAKDFESQIGSTVNRLQRFIRNDSMRRMFGQPDVSLDFQDAFREGSIILVNLSLEGAKISPENAELFATLLLSDLWNAARERGKRDENRSFYVYIDEFQRFITPTMAENLDEARGYGLHLTMAHQFPLQLLDQGEAGRRVYNSVMVNAKNKVVFQIAGEDNLRPLAQELFMGTMDPGKIKHELYSTKVVGYLEERRTSYSRGTGRGTGETTQTGSAAGKGHGGTESFLLHDGQVPDDPTSISDSSSEFASISESEGRSRSEFSSEGEVDAPMLVPIMGKEVSSVQFEPLEEQLFRAMSVLHEQEQRYCVARVMGLRMPLSLYTPTVKQFPKVGRKERVESYTKRMLRRLPYALLRSEADRRLQKRESKFLEKLENSSVKEPETSRRRVDS
jgi:hypothetical protein